LENFVNSFVLTVVLIAVGWLPQVQAVARAGVRISGRVSTPADQLARTRVTMTGTVTREAKPNSDGSFEFTDVVPGRYVLRAEIPEMLGGSETLVVGAEDMKDIELRLAKVLNQIRVPGRIVALPRTSLSHFPM
jgi:Carboxypeptidase regulatory-like domain